MSPRRSSRARSSQQPPATTQANSSSSSSSTATLKEARLSRTGASNRSLSPRTASVQRSESIDDADSMARSDQIAPRRSRRGVEADKEAHVKQQSVDDEENDVIEDDVTRCICGQAEYPGPSASIQEQYGSAALSDDIGNFFVQCDNCHVWQHGGCMGLNDESITPEEYYCEKCRPDYHKIVKGSNATKSSRYLPVLESSSRPTPLTAADQARLKDIKNKALQNTKRRATMNSRGAYDEDEMLRRAIEESKVQDSLGKRTREDGDDRRPANKRQRTSTSASDVSSKKSGTPEPADRSMATGKNGSKLRGAAARNTREKEVREKQKQEAAAQRAEAASKRNARSERRRADDSPPPTPTISPSKPVQQPSGKGKADTPQPGKGSATRKTGGRPGGRGKRVGRNQYTRDLYDPADGILRDGSRDANGHSPHGINGDTGRSSKARTHSARTSLNEMKKRVAAILEFVSQMQSQQSNSSSNKQTSSNSNGSTSRSSNGGKGNSTPNGMQLGGTPTSKLVEAVTAGLQDSGDGKVKMLEEGEFSKMGSVQMMETLMKELVGWQTVYIKKPLKGVFEKHQVDMRYGELRAQARKSLTGV